MSEELINKKELLLVECAISDVQVFSKCVRILKPSYFDKPLERVVGFIVSYFNDYHSCPNVNQIEAETGILLQKHETEEHERQYILDELEEHCKRAAMTEAILASVEHIHRGEQSIVPELVRDALMVKLDASIGVSLFDDPEMRISAMSGAVDERGIGIPALDNYIGKVRRGELNVIYAPSSGGKSVMLGNIAYLMSMQGLDIDIISLELSEELYCKRLDVIFTGTDIKNHSSNSVKIGNDLRALVGDAGGVNVKGMRAKTTTEDIRIHLTEYHIENGKYPDVLIVDYLALMGTSHQYKNKYDEHEEIAIMLRDIAKEFNMYLFTAAQINREGQDVMKLNASHVAGGISVINTSDTAFALVANEQDIDNNQMGVVQLKMRNGVKYSQPITLYRHPRNLRISDTPFSDADKVKHSTPLNTKKPSEGIDNSKGRDKLMRALNKRK